jgi:hypothetical protein
MHIALSKVFFGQLQKHDIEAQGLGGLKHGHKTNLTHIYYIHLYGSCCLWLEYIKFNIRPTHLNIILVEMGLI